MICPRRSPSSPGAGSPRSAPRRLQSKPSALRARKVANLERLQPDVVAAGNIGCLTQIAGATTVPVVHTVELLDWASGGPAPAGLG